MRALGQETEDKDDFELADELQLLSGTAIPQAVEEIRHAQVLHHTVTPIEGMRSVVTDFLNKR